MSPSLTSSSPASIRRLVDLPQPEGPTRTRNSPSAMSMLSRSTEGVSLPGYVRLALSNLTVAMWVSFLHRQERAGRSVVKVTNAVAASLVRADAGQVRTHQVVPVILADGRTDARERVPDWGVLLRAGSLCKCSLQFLARTSGFLQELAKFRLLGVGRRAAHSFPRRNHAQACDWCSGRNRRRGTAHECLRRVHDRRRKAV